MLATLLVGAMATLGPAIGTDTTFSAAGVTRLHANTQGGEIIVRTWNRDQIRVQAEHSSRARLDVERSGETVTLRIRGRGVVHAVDYTITVPARMGLDLGGLNADVDVQGVTGDVDVKTVQGEVTVRGGRGRVRLQSVNGSVRLENAQGDISAKTVSGSVSVQNVSGDIVAESVSGGVDVRGDARSVQATTISGEVIYSGPLRDGGAYFFSSHSGSVVLDVPENSDATFTIATVSGSFRSGFRVTVPPQRSGRRFSFTVGSGRAQVEAESFSGDVIVGPRTNRTNRGN